MIFLELILQNFGPYSGRQTINLNPSVDYGENPPPIILFGGMNGGGKTTLMDAIRLALYGHRAQCSTRGNLSYSDFLSQCVNSKTIPPEKTRIELVFEHIEADKPVKYRIVRTWEKNPKDGKDSLGILGDDDTWPVDSLANMWDEYIENILPLGISTLFLFDGEQVKELAEQETPPPNLVDAISGLLGLELADRLTIDLDVLINRKRKEIAGDEDLGNLQALEYKLTHQQSSYQDIQAELEILKSQILDLENNQKEAFNKFITAGGKIAAERSQLEQQQQRKNTLVAEIRKSMSELSAGVLPLALIFNLLTQTQRQGTREFRYQQIQIAKNLLLERDERLLNWLEESSLLKTKLDRIQSFLRQDIDNLYQPNLETESPWLFADLNTLTKLDQLICHLESSQSIAQEKIENLKIREEEVITLERQIQTAAAPEEYTNLLNILEDAQNQVAKFKVSYELKQRDLQDLMAAIEQSKQELNEYTVENIKHKNNEHIINSAAQVQQTLKIFRERLTLRKLNKLEEEVKNCFLYLLHKSDLVHRIAIDNQTFSLSLYDFHSQPVPKHRLSAGEKQLLAIAFLWGLAKVSGRRLPIAIDTPLGRLDSSHRHNLVERYFPVASHQVILLSTDTEIAEKEFLLLQENAAIARSYLLKYDPIQRQTNIQPGYFVTADNAT
jgi:DNA sulfur modification protein DndD